MQFLFLILGYFAFCFTHLLFLDSAPGFHFDEAWAAEHSLRIAFDSGFWPFRAMTVQTSSWSHYVTALFFKLFTPSVFHFRLSYFFLNFLTLSLLSLGLKNFSYSREARILPWVAAFFPALVMNHRFAIEITAFHSFCFALLFCSISFFQKTKRAWPWAGIIAAAFFGFTSHVFFLGVLAALLWMVATGKNSVLKKEKTRFFVALLVLFLLPFVWNISNEIIWKWKGRALLCLFVAVLGWLLIFKAKLPSWIPKCEKLIFAIAAPFLFNFLLFSESHWIVLHHMGKIEFPFLVGIQFVFMAAVLGVFLKTQMEQDPKLKLLVRFFMVLVAASGLVMITQAPRYYEIPFWIFALLFSMALGWMWKTHPKVRLVIPAWFCFAALTLALNYYKVGIAQEGIQNEFRFLVLKESSYDYLPKNEVKNFLSSTGCWDELSVSDERLRYTFSVLRKLEERSSQLKSCSWQKLCLEKFSQGNISGKKILLRTHNFVIQDCGSSL